MRRNLVLLTALLCLSQLFAGGWNVGVGGIPARYGLSETFGPSQPEIAWSGGLNTAFAQQAVTEGNVVVVARTQNINDVLHGTTIVAYDTSDGSELWTADLPVTDQNTNWRSRVSSARDGYVYCSRSGNTLDLSPMYCLDITDGSIVWTSEAGINEGTTESCSFAPDGDLIVGNFYSVLRIDAQDGSTVWESPRTAPSSDGCQIAVVQDRCYGWQSGAQGPKVKVWNLASGQELYESAGIIGGYVQQLGLFVGPDGTVYAPRAQNNPVTDYLVAFEDTGTGLNQLWQSELGYVPFASFAVGADGAVYSYSRNREIVRLDPETGQVTATSSPLASEGAIYPRICIDSAGIIYITNGKYGEGMLYSFNADLTPRWNLPVTNVNLGGPALAEDGTLIVCGAGTEVIAIRFNEFPPPLNLTAAYAWPDDVELSWEEPDNTDDLTSYLIYRDDVLIETIDYTTGTFYTDSDLAPGTYSWHVTAMHGDTESVPSNGVTIEVPDLAPPASLTADILPNLLTVDLAWEQPDSDSELTGFRLYRNNNLLHEITTPAQLWFSDILPDWGGYVYHVTAVYLGSYESMPSNSVTVEAVETDEAAAPELVTRLHGAFPNPFNPQTEIRFDLVRPSFVILEIFNTRGQKIRSLLNDRLEAGSHAVVWDANGLSSGMYLCRMRTGEGEVAVKRLLLLK